MVRYHQAEQDNKEMAHVSTVFFELIRVAIGTQSSLSQLPSGKEWKALYDMAKKQSLVGVCFAALQRLGADADEGFARIGMNEMLYLTWMGMAAKIQQRNQIVDKQCVTLQKRLAADGMRSCILKGQGVGLKYSEHLFGLRQSGDIDVWVQNKSIEELVEYVRGLGHEYKATAIHVECTLVDDTMVELHANPAFLRNFLTNRKLVKWFNDSKTSIIESELGFYVPTNEFNLVYMMVHMYHHVLYEGLGLRQVMDYYFVLRQFHENPEFQKVSNVVIKTWESLGMQKFASGILWVIKYVFGDLKILEIIPWVLNEKVGKLLLDEIMTGGNFGHHDDKNMKLHGGTAISRSLNGLKRNMKFFSLGHWEILSSPMWSTWHWQWRKRKGII